MGLLSGEQTTLHSVIEVIVGSFLPSYQLEQKTKTKHDSALPLPTPTDAIPVSSIEMEETYQSGSGHGPPQHQQQSRISSTPRPILTTASSFRGENWSASLHSSVQEARNSSTDINVSLPGV
ncbi:hypothetical protein KSP40_PGU020841 [Platanthera guangdongensis]|uniref:Uncharacterized protein n=1 Tax=Platanthera guangdongensis TaxID=2320717 RepID=A0ABR2LPW5_9ASPA